MFDSNQPSLVWPGIAQMLQWLDYRLDGWEVVTRCLVGVRDLSSDQTGSRARPATCLMGTGILSPGHGLFRAEVKSKWSHASSWNTTNCEWNVPLNSFTVILCKQEVEFSDWYAKENWQYTKHISFLCMVNLFRSACIYFSHSSTTEHETTNVNNTGTVLKVGLL